MRRVSGSSSRAMSTRARETRRTCCACVSACGPLSCSMKLLLRTSRAPLVTISLFDCRHASRAAVASSLSPPPRSSAVSALCVRFSLLLGRVASSRERHAMRLGTWYRRFSHRWYMKELRMCASSKLRSTMPTMRDTDGYSSLFSSSSTGSTAQKKPPRQGRRSGGDSFMTKWSSMSAISCGFTSIDASGKSLKRPGRYTGRSFASVAVSTMLKMISYVSSTFRCTPDGREGFRVWPSRFDSSSFSGMMPMCWYRWRVFCSCTMALIRSGQSFRRSKLTSTLRSSSRKFLNFGIFACWSSSKSILPALSMKYRYCS
eukprot:Rhum_TRINITY_DN14099_c5_g1::Rhum_TRINITY_DN14099_c5_g1_i1::g.67736::m.67736